MDGLRAVNVYVLETPTGLVLVDGGWAVPDARAAFDRAFAGLGFATGDIRRFLVTHVHRDHYTLARALADEVGAEVLLGLGDRASMDLMHSRYDEGDPNLARLAAAGADHLAAVWDSFGRRDAEEVLRDYGMPDTWLDRDLVIDLGDRQLQALSTPGHTQGHYVFADLEAQVLFAGDHVLPRITPSIGFEPAWVQDPLGDFLTSLATVRALPDLTLLPAHGAVAPSVHARVDELVEHHVDRLAASLEAVEGGAGTAWEVAGELPWTSRAARLADLPSFDQVLASFETLAHLELLALRGELTRTTDGDTVRFGAPPVSA